MGRHRSVPTTCSKYRDLHNSESGPQTHRCNFSRELCVLLEERDVRGQRTSISQTTYRSEEIWRDRRAPNAFLRCLLLSPLDGRLDAFSRESMRRRR